MPGTAISRAIRSGSKPPHKHKHWRGIQAEMPLEGAPVLDFTESPDPTAISRATYLAR